MLEEALLEMNGREDEGNNDKVCVSRRMYLGGGVTLVCVSPMSLEAGD